MSEAPKQTPKVQPRQITDHQLADPVNNQIRISAVDEPGPGGANHQYFVGIKEGETVTRGLCVLQFQKGGFQEAGVNGITHEALLAIVIDRLRCFQNGSFKCDENAKALAMAQHSLAWLKRRSEERIKRGVEGKSVK
jgi:hypothetical protein